MLALIIYNAEVRNNLELSLGLNKIIFIVSIIKLLYLAYSFNYKMTMCQLSNQLFC